MKRYSIRKIIRKNAVKYPRPSSSDPGRMKDMKVSERDRDKIGRRDVRKVLSRYRSDPSSM